MTYYCKAIINRGTYAKVKAEMERRMVISVVNEKQVKIVCKIYVFLCRDVHLYIWTRRNVNIRAVLFTWNKPYHRSVDIGYHDITYSYPNNSGQPKNIFRL